MKRFIKSAIACIAAVAMVVAAVPATVTTQAATKNPVVVTNQKQLDAAIKKGATKITIKTSKNVKITIPASKKAAKANIVVDAKNATITNKATVMTLTVKDAKAFTESGKNNDIKITDKKLTVTVAKASKGADIQIAKTDANVKVVANGAVNSVTVSKKATLSITGKSDNMIDVYAVATGAKVSTAVPAAVTADAKATITIAKGADGSTVTANADVKVSVAKNTTVASVAVAEADVKVDLSAKGTVSDVTVVKGAEGAQLNITASGKVENVTVNAKADVAVAGTTTETVKVTVNAADTTVKAETAVDTTLNADAKVDLAAGAEGSKVATGSSDVKAEVANGTTDKVTVTDSTGKETTVEAGKDQTTSGESSNTVDKTPAVDTGSNGNTGNDSGNSGIVVNPPAQDQPVQPNSDVEALKATIISAQAFEYSDEMTDYLTLKHLSLSDDKVAVTAHFDSNRDKVWIQGMYNELSATDKIAATGVYTEKNKAADAYVVDKFVMNTFARFVGALRRSDAAATVQQIKFGGKAYSWKEEMDSKGSKWVDTENKTLISAVVAEQNSAIRNVTFDLVNAKGTSVTMYFKAVDVPSPDIIDTPQKALKAIAKSALEYTYPSEDAQNYLPLSNLTYADGIISGTFTKGNSLSYIKSVYDFKSSQGQIDDGKINGKDAVDYAIDSCVMNTFARYVGALYRQDNGQSVAKIIFNGAEYTWNSEKDQVGSNWYNESTSLVSAVVNAADNKALRTATLTLVDQNGKTDDITFNANVSVTKDEIIGDLQNGQ